MCSRNSSHIGTSKGQPFVLQSCPDLERERAGKEECECELKLRVRCQTNLGCSFPNHTQTHANIIFIVGILFPAVVLIEFAVA